jgi:hypothetical protein
MSARRTGERRCHDHGVVSGVLSRCVAWMEHRALPPRMNGDAQSRGITAMQSRERACEEFAAPFSKSCHPQKLPGDSPASLALPCPVPCGLPCRLPARRHREFAQALAAVA